MEEESPLRRRQLYKKADSYREKETNVQQHLWIDVDSARVRFHTLLLFSYLFFWKEKGALCNPGGENVKNSIFPSSRSKDACTGNSGNSSYPLISSSRVCKVGARRTENEIH